MTNSTWVQVTILKIAMTETQTDERRVDSKLFGHFVRFQDFATVIAITRVLSVTKCIY